MKKFTAIMLALLMVVSIIPMSVLADSAYSWTVATSVESTIAKGVVQTSNVAYNTEGNRVAFHTVTADITRDDVDVYANYYNNQLTEFGIQTVIDQAHAAEKNHADVPNYKVVATTNADFYNMSTGQPIGVLVMEGVTMKGSGTSRSFFGIKKDGTPIVGKAGEYTSVADEIQEAVGGGVVMLYDGQILVNNDRTSTNAMYPRSIAGYTPEGKVVLLVADGSQPPVSYGMSYYDVALQMQAMGCTYAIELDGGGSATMATKAEGEDELSVLNNPCDGAMRTVSSSLMVVSTAVSDGTFDHAALTAEETYVTPESTVKVSAVGADAAGGPAVIPEDVSWQLKDASLGTVKDGVFTSNGTVGDAVVQMVYNGNVVGETTIKVVIPEEISFVYDNIVVPYDKTLEFTVNATVNGGVNDVVLKDGDIEFTLSDSKLGTVNGNKFTACSASSGLTSGSVTATFKYDATKTDTATLTFGRGSEIVYDFEDGDLTGLEFVSGYFHKDKHGRWAFGEMSVEGKDTGKVKNGEKSLALVNDYSRATTMGWKNLALKGLNIDLTDAVRVGFWMHAPKEAIGMCEVDFNNSIVVDDFYSTVLSDGYDGQWFYVSCPASKLGGKLDSLYFYWCDSGLDKYTNYASEFTVFIDDITVDYSDAVSDRTLPVFTNTLISYDGLSDSVAINGQTIAKNEVFVSAKVTDNTAIDASSAKVYVDGNELADDMVNCTNAGFISTDNIVLADGPHDFTFEIRDLEGNETIVTRSATIAAESDLSTVKFVPQDPDAKEIPIGSVQWFDLVATDIEKTEKITATIDLDGVSNWEFDGMEVAYGFEAEYSVDKFTNDATITLTKTGDVELTGEQVVASIPVRTWIYTNHLDYPDEVSNSTNPGDNSGAITPYSIWKSDAIRRISMIIKVDAGTVEFADGTTSTFSSKEKEITTELKFFRDQITTAEVRPVIAAKYAFHEHNNVVAIPDKAATCTEAGYTGRTICTGCKCNDYVTDQCDAVEGCGSVVDWGTIVPATGHTYEVEDGVLKCKDCDKLFNGELDGKTYVDGIALDGWVGDKYYKDGAMFTGVKAVEGVYYNFGEDGVSKGVYTGDFTGEDGKHYYAKLGALVGGWFTINDEWYYFDETTFAGVSGEMKFFGKVTYTFEDGRLTSGVWYTDEIGTRYYYGPDYYKTILVTIDGEQYYFSNGYRYEEGIHCLRLSAGNSDVVAYEMGKNGAIIGEYKGNGLITTAEGKFYLKDGIAQRGLHLIDGNYYYFHTIYGYAYVYRKYNVTVTNGYDFTPGVYEFDENGVIVDKNGYYEENGVNYYYINNVRIKSKLVKIDDDYYYLDADGQIFKDGKVYVYSSACDLPAGLNYYFGADGKALNGVIDGKLYTNGQLAPTGLHKVGDDYYYSESGKVIVDRKYYASKTNCDLAAKAYYYFDTEGKALKGVVDGKLYINGQVAPTGLTKYGNDYYYSESGKVVVDRRYYAAKTNCDLAAKDYYYFGADGKMLQGVVDGKLYINGQPAKRGLTKFGDDYYYSESGTVIVDRRYYATLSNCDLPAKEYYFFGADGKMLQGVVDGKLYIKGQIAPTGLTKYGEDYYYSESGKVIVDRRYYAAKTNCDLAAKDYYFFGVDGKMLQGVVDGKLYIKGQIAPTGLTKYGEDYYYSESGKAVTGKYYAAKTNCDLAADTYYYFGEDGKMLEGVVDGKLYIGGQIAPTGLTKYGDDYYYSESGKVVTGKYYASKTNCDLAAKDYYYFGEDGKMLEGVVNGYLYLGGKRAPTGLTKYGDNYYYSQSGKLATGKCYASVTNCDLPAKEYYYFDEDGTFCEGVYTEEDGVYYYEAGKRVFAGLVEVDGSFYYAGSGGKCLRSTKQLCLKSSCVLPINREYTFGADGKMVK